MGAGRSCRRTARRRRGHPRLRDDPLGDGGSARPAEERGGPDDVLHAPARVPVHRGGGAVHRPTHARLRGRAEPRRPDAEPAQAGSDAGAGRQAAEHRVLLGAADRRAHDFGRDPGPVQSIRWKIDVKISQTP